MLVSKIESSKRMQKKQKQRWHAVINADLKSLDMVSTWRTKALVRNEWQSKIHSKLNELNQFKEKSEKAKKDLKKENKKSETDLKCPHVINCALI